MAEEQIVTNIVAKSDFSNLIADLNKVTSALTNLQAKLNATNKNLASQVNVMNRSFAETMRSTGQYSTHFVSLASDVDKFGVQLDKGQIKLKQFAQIYQSHIKTSGGLVRQLAQQQVQLQNAILQPLGKNAEGLMQYNVHIPAGLDKVKSKSALARQELQIMNKVVQEGANSLINWGKNTQWAGRQLTVGLTLPLAAFGKASADAFRAADQELTRLTKVYGGLAATSAEELGKVRQDVTKTASELSKAYGSSFRETIALGADIAATGKQGNELLGSIRETTRLSVLGEVDRQDAMKATLAIQSAFKSNTDELAESINFLNAVENQTSTTLNDLVEAIPKAGPIIKGLGGDVQDLALYLTAMREGGVSASEGANALKSGLASLINPTKVAKEMFAGFGISLTDIVQKNAGNTTETLLALQSALDSLNPLQKQQALEQLFGKFQFARMNALFENLGKQGSQTLQVMDLMKASSEDLANIAGRELSMVTESAAGKYKRALEGLKADLAGVGEQFLRINTYLINIVDGILQFAGKLPGPVKTILGLLGGFTAIAGPMIMLTGVLGNFFGYIIKGVSHMRALTKGGEGWKLLTPDILAANKAGGLVEQTFYSDAKASEILNTAINRLSASYQKLAADANNAMISTNPAISTTAGTLLMTNKDPRRANPAHSMIGPFGSRAAAHHNPRGDLSALQRSQQTIHSITPQPELVNQAIKKNPQIFTYQDMPNIPGLTNIGGVSTGIVAGEAAKWHTLMSTLSMQTKQEVAQLEREIARTGTVSQEFMSTYSQILPAMTSVVDNAVLKSQQIIQKVQMGELQVDQARAKIIAINARLEADMIATSNAMAAQMSRTANLTGLPLTGQAIVDKTGKSNVREMFRDDRKVKQMMDVIARATGVRTSGGGYSIETTMPKKFATGGRVFGGPRSDTTDTQFEYLPEGSFVLNRKASDSLLGFNQGGLVPAMVTPGEILIENPTSDELAMLEAYNNQFAVGGRVKKSKNNYGIPFRTIDKLQTINNMQSRNAGSAPISNKPGMSMDEYYKQQRAAKKARAAGVVSTNVRNKVFSQIENKLSPYEKSLYVDSVTGRHQDRAHGITGSVAEGAKPRPGYFGIASVSPYNKIQNKLHKVIKTRDVNPVTDATAQDEILPDIFEKMGSGKWFDNNAKVNGVLDIGKVQSYIDHLKSVSPFGGKWDSKTFGMSPFRGLSRQAISRDELADYLEYLISGQVTKINKTGIILNDASALVQHKKMDVDKAIDLAEKIYNGTMSEGYNDHAYYAKRSDIDLKVFPKNYNAGGVVGGRVRGGKYNYGKLPKGFLDNALINNLSNDNPNHGVLQIGRFQHPMSIRNRRQSAGVRFSGSYSPYTFPKGPKAGQTTYYSKRSALTGAFLTGSLEERGKYVTEEYMRGSYDVLKIPGAIEAMKAYAKKATGKFHRGITLNGWSKVGGMMPPLPKWLINDINLAKQSGDFSKLIGKEFIMRRSSWSSNPETASGFGDFQLEADVKNRRVTPASEMFPRLKFATSTGSQVEVNESESIFGGKFKIVSADNTGLKLATVNKSKAKKYNRGGIVGGRVRRGKNNYGELDWSRTPFGKGFRPTGITSQSEEMTMPTQKSSLMSGMAMNIASMGAMMGGATLGGKYGGTLGSIAGSILAPSLMSSVLQKITAVNKAGTTTAGIFGRLSPIMSNPYLMAGAAIVGVTAGLLKLKSRIEETARVNRLAFSGGVKPIKDFDSELKQVRKSIEDTKATAALLHAQMNSAGLSGLTLTIKEFSDLREKIKSTHPELIKLFNQTPPDKLSKVAEGLKAQFVAAGDSAAQANAKIAALLTESGKGGFIQSVLGSEGVKGIVNAQTAISSMIKSLDGFKSGKDRAAGMLQVFSSISDYLGTSTDKGAALKEQFDLIAKSGQANVKLTQDQIVELSKVDPILAGLLNTSDNIGTALAKWRLALAGVEKDLNGLTQDQLMRFAQAAEGIGAYYNKLLDVSSKEAQNNKMTGTLAKDIDTFEKKQANASKSAIQSLEKQIELKNKQIEQIKKEADARKKALRDQQQIEDVRLQIQQEQLSYQSALAAGDMSSAAQAQINIQRLVGQQQLKTAEDAIDSAAQAKIDALQAQIDTLNKKSTAVSNAASTAKPAKSPLRPTYEGIQGVYKDYALGNIDEATAASRLNDLVRKLEQTPGGKNYLKDMGVEKSVGNLVREDGQTTKTALNLESGVGKQLADALKKGSDNLVVQAIGKSNNYLADILLAIKTNGVNFDKGKTAGDKSYETTSGKVAAGELNTTGTAKTYSEKTLQGSAKTAFNDRNSAKAAGVGKSYRLFSFDGKTYAVNTVDGQIYEFDTNKNNISGKSLGGFASGGMVRRYATAGIVSGPGTGTSDSIPAMLSNGEYVIRSAAVQAVGTSFLDGINRMSAGGIATKYSIPRMSMGGRVNMSQAGSASTSNALYNINVTLNETGLTADDVARTIEERMRRMQSKQGPSKVIA